MSSTQSNETPFVFDLENWPTLNCGLVANKLARDPLFRPEYLQQNRLAFDTLWQIALLSMIAFFRRLMDFEIMDDPFTLVIVHPDDIDALDADVDERVDVNHNCMKKRALHDIMYLLRLEKEGEYAGHKLMDFCLHITEMKAEMSSWSYKYQSFMEGLRRYKQDLSGVDDGRRLREFRLRCKEAGIAPFGFITAKDITIGIHIDTLHTDIMQIMQNKLNLGDLPRLDELLRPDAEYDNLGEYMDPFQKVRQTGRFKYAVDEAKNYNWPDVFTEPQELQNVFTTDLDINCNSLLARLMNNRYFIFVNTHHPKLFDALKRRVLQTLTTYLAHVTSLGTYDRLFSVCNYSYIINANSDRYMLIRDRSIKLTLIDQMAAVSVLKRHTCEVNGKMDDACDFIRVTHRRISLLPERHMIFMSHIIEFRKHACIRTFRKACKEDGIAPFFILEGPDDIIITELNDSAIRMKQVDNDDIYLNSISFTTDALLPLWANNGSD